MARHLFAPDRPGAPRSRARAARGRLLPLLLLALLVPAACDSSTGSPASEGADAGSGVDAGSDDLGKLGGSVPGCPFTADRVSELLGQSLKDEGNCVFGDGKGVASLTITMASEFAGATTYDYQHEQAGQQYEKVVDLGDRSYLAAKDIAAEAVVVGPKGSYTLIMSSFSMDVAGYEQKLRRLLDALPA
ncbi:hypothetical protein ONA91_16600 [Micromonospora sp. DR5-3]|uniref:hypothetical protein n=1 Tax=unclassified Micromonospora TaxID=2617518 RepID=UPI0011D3F48B|nr:MULTISPECIES: hypothetical protein [unclassified Micromonospora]MCW3816063.1 hypothetical protein [Micromonospora sp. DR5-3]TYC21262.1 hypothetical protein FXF52_26685 [Micromonospora sp. MP36]